MSGVDIHPEDLFDKLVDGSLSDVESERLRAHLDACDVCRFELAVRGDFRAETAVASDAGRASAPRESTEPARGRRAAGRRRARRAIVWIGAAAALTIATGALASVIMGRPPWQLLSASDGAPPSGSNSPALPRSKRVLQRESAGPLTAAPSESSVPSTPVEAAGGHPSVGEPQTSSTSGRSIPERANDAENAASLFKAANRARGAGDLARAVKLYRRLQREFPGSSEAALSQLTLATLLLHTGDARGALSAFDAYLARPSRPLEAEALVGRAVALRALGQSEAEILAWQAILRRYPGSSYGRRAADRLAAVGRL